MKYTELISSTKRIYFKKQKDIFAKIYDRHKQFIEASFHNPNEIYMSQRAYNELMKSAYDVYYYPSSTNGYIPELGSLMGMKITVSSQLMANEIIMLRTIE